MSGPAKTEPEPTTEPEAEKPDAMHQSVVRTGERRERWRRDEPRALMVALSVTGIGWTIVVPTVLGFIVGRWLDQRLHTGIVLAAGLGTLGLALGCVSAWRWVRHR
jgi:ATP synthase protein I